MNKSGKKKREICLKYKKGPEQLRSITKSTELADKNQNENKKKKKEN